jgi:hypothetical protein
VNLFSGLDTLVRDLKCRDQLDEFLSWELNLKLTFPVEDTLHHPLVDRLRETLNQLGNPWPESE